MWCYYHFKYLNIFTYSIYAYQDVTNLSFYWFQTYDITLLTLKTCYVSILCDTGAFVYEIFFNSFLFFFQFFLSRFFFLCDCVRACFPFGRFQNSPIQNFWWILTTWTDNFFSVFTKRWIHQKHPTA